MGRVRLLLPLCAVFAISCSTDPSLTEGPEVAHSPDMFRDVLASLTQADMLPDDGDWPMDYGDANHYGPGFFYRYGGSSGNAAQRELADATHAHDVWLIDDALDTPVRLLQVPDDLIPATFGLIEHYEHDPQPEDAARIEAFLDLVDVFVEGYDYYPETFEIIYGPTTINGALALLNLEYALVATEAAAPARIARAEEIIAAGRAIAYDDELGYYRYAPDQDRLYLYPNIMQILAHARAYELTGEQSYLDRAELLHAAIQPLKVAGEGRYLSPYSAEYMGAQTDDYTTLSSQNYTMLALGLLYDLTGDDAYRAEVLDLLGFIETKLLADDGRVLHHWIDGHIAHPDDLEYYCQGCNLQLLYVIFRLEELL
jgi:hypothetical protein